MVYKLTLVFQRDCILANFTIGKNLNKQFYKCEPLRDVSIPKESYAIYEGNEITLFSYHTPKGKAYPTEKVIIVQPVDVHNKTLFRLIDVHHLVAYDRATNGTVIASYLSQKTKSTTTYWIPEEKTDSTAMERVKDFIMKNIIQLKQRFSFKNYLIPKSLEQLAQVDDKDIVDVFVLENTFDGVSVTKLIFSDRVRSAIYSRSAAIENSKKNSIM